MSTRHSARTIPSRRRRGASPRWLCAATWVALAACGADDSPAMGDGGGTEGATGDWPAACPPELAAPGILCDGSDALRFAAAQFVNGLVDYDLPWEIGSFYLYIDGQCRYWAFNPENNTPVGPAHHGTLSVEQEDALVRAFAYPCFDALAGFYAVPGDDVPSRVFSDGVHTIQCLGACQDNPPDVAPPDVRALDQALRDVWLPMLIDAGTPNTGPMRVAVALRREEADFCAEPWPFGWPATDLVRDQTQSGVDAPGVLVDDPDTVELIREMQRHYLEDVPGGGCNYLKSTGAFHFDYEGMEYSLVARDAVPFEDEDGRVAIPKPPAP